jgi:hypothetical protein
LKELTPQTIAYVGWIEYTKKRMVCQEKSRKISDSANRGKLEQVEGKETKEGRVVEKLWAGKRDGKLGKSTLAGGL